MSRYIDADFLLEKMQAFDRTFDENYDRYGFGYDDCFCAVEDTIAGIPTEDVVEVKHGKWKCMGDVGVTQCNLCGWSIEECIEYKFCPECGAKMDGGNE